MKDVTLCLGAANGHNVSIGRLALQKIVYLFDSMSTYLYIVSGKTGHQTYFFGPYDKNIQNAVDALVIRDLVSTENYRIGKNNSVTCNYSLTQAGIDWHKIVLSGSKSIQYRAQIADAILYSLVQRNLLSKVKSIVYAEPMFNRVKEHGHYYDLDFSDDNEGHSYLSLIEHYLKCNKNSIDIPFAVDMYIDYLHTRSEIFSVGSLGEDDFDAINIR